MTSTQRGITLVEIAIVLVLIGLLVSVGASLIGPLTKRVKVTETREIIDAAVESITGFSAKNYRLPADYEFPQVVRNPKDAWGKNLVYIFDANLANIPQNPAEGICGKAITRLTICRDINCTSQNQIQNVAFLVVSSGENFNLQTGPFASPSCPSGKICIRVLDQGVPNVDDYPNDFQRLEDYDDIVKWMTVNELRIKAGCRGAPLKILNNELPYGYEGSNYNGAVYAEGGTPFSIGGKYRWCIEGNPPSNLDFKDQTNAYIIFFSTNCKNDPEIKWTRADYIKISGMPSNHGSFILTFFVRDNSDPTGNNDNIAQKTFVLTIHPHP